MKWRMQRRGCVTWSRNSAESGWDKRRVYKNVVSETSEVQHGEQPGSCLCWLQMIYRLRRGSQSRGATAEELRTWSRPRLFSPVSDAASFVIILAEYFLRSKRLKWWLSEMRTEAAAPDTDLSSILCCCLPSSGLISKTFKCRTFPQPGMYHW